MAKTASRPEGRAASADRRRAELLEATRQVAVERGMSSMRVADIATATNVSGGLIHYHFATKDELVAAMLRASAQEEREQLEAMVGDGGPAVARLDRVLGYYIPRARDDQSWILWIEAWAASLRSPVLREIITELTNAWMNAVECVIRDGVVAGEFACADPAGAAERLDSMLDGLLLRLTVNPGSLTRARVLEHARVCAARELGLDRAAFPVG